MSSEMTSKTGRVAKAFTAAVATVSMLLTVFAGATPAEAATIVTVPGAPAAPTATLPGVGQIQVNWLSPLNTGGSPITGYTLMSSTSSTFAAGPTTITSTETGTSKTLTNLVAGTSYYFKVAARNAKGQGLFSSVRMVVAPRVTSAPGSVKAIRGIRATTVSWVAPLTTTTLPVTGYKVQYSTDKTFASNVTNLDATSSPLNIPNLSNATTYYYRVAAVNAVGNSAWSSIVAAATYAMPNAPSVPKVVPGNATLTATWTKPISDLAVTGYRVQYSTDRNFVTNVQTIDTTALTATFSSLASGSAYFVRVAAISAVGTSAYSAAGTATTFTAPGSPTSLVITRGVESLKVAFRAPSVTGGTALTGSTVEYADNADFTDSQTVNLATGVSTTTLTGLATGTTYYIRVSAKNAVGSSVPTATVSARTYALPGAVTTGTLATSRTAGTLSAAWTNPTATLLDTLAITSANIEVATDADFTNVVRTVTTTGAIATSSISGLENGTRYYYRVRVNTAAGASAWSASLASATTLAVPNQPTNLTLKGNATSINVSWAAPEGGATPTGYRVMVARSANFLTSPSVFDAKAATSYTVTGLTTNTTYYVRVLAYNTTGAGLYTPGQSVFTASTPTAPLNVAGQAVAATKNMTFTWAEPANGAPITGYRVQYSTDSAFVTGVQTVDSLSTSLTVTAPEYGQTYYVRVSASNSYGYGNYSAAVTVAGPALPADSLLASLSTTVSGRSMTVNYDYSTGDVNASVYSLEYSKNADFSNAVSYNLTANPSSSDVATQVQVTGYRTFNNLSNGTYYVRMVVTNSIGDARVQSVTATGVVDVPVGAPGTPAVPTITATGAGQLTFTWPAVEGNGDDNIIYTLQYSTDKYFATDVTAVQVTDASYVATGLAAGTVYYARVKATNSAGDSGYSASDVQSHSVVFTGDINGNTWGTPRYVYYFAMYSGGDFYMYVPGGEGNLYYDHGIEDANIVVDGVRYGETVHYEGTISRLPNGNYIFTDTIGNGAPGWTGIYWGMPEFTITLSWDTTAFKGKTWSAPGSVSSWFMKNQSETSIEALWTAPQNNGGAEITEYKVEYSTDPTFATNVQVGTSTTNSFLATDLTPGSRYYFRVTAKNGAGYGPAFVINSNGTVSAAAANAPTNVALTTDQDGLYITFTAPSDYNSADTTGQGTWCIDASSSEDPVNNWYSNYWGCIANITMDNPAPAPGSQVTLALPAAANEYVIQNGRLLTVRITANFPEFNGLPSAPSNSVTFVGADSQAPRVWGDFGTTNTPEGATGKSVYVNAYNQNNGYALTGYRLEYSKSSAFPAGQTTVVDYADTTHGMYATISGLEPNTKYFFRLRGLYDGGTGRASSTYEVTTLDLAAPTTPTITSVGAANADGSTYDLSWTPSQQQGDGTAFDRYVVTVTGWLPDQGIYGPKGTVVQSDNKVSTASITGLTAGETYSVEIRAYSVTGQYSSAGTSFVARAPYAAPANFTITAQDSNPQYGPKVSWNQPEATYGTIYSHIYQVATDAAFTNLIVNDTYYNWDNTAGRFNQINVNLPNAGQDYIGQTLYVRVAARDYNSGDRGLFATGTYLVPTTPPTSPTGVSADVANDLSVTVTWSGSVAQAGGDALDRYEVVITSNSGMCSMSYGSPECSAPQGTVVYPTDRLQTTATVTGLVEGERYYATVYAYSTSGSRSVAGYDMMTGQTNRVSFSLVPSLVAPAVTAQVGVDSMMGTSNLKYIGVTATPPSDPYNRVSSGMGSPTMYYEVASDAGFTNVLARTNTSLMNMGMGYSPTTITFRGEMDQWNMSVISEFVTGQTYYVRARLSYNSMSYGSGYSLWSAPVAYKIPTTPPTSPASPSASVADDLTVTLSWGPSSQQDGGDPVEYYEVVVTQYDSMCGMMGNCDYSPKGTVTYPTDRLQPTATVTGLNSGSQYRATIVAVSTSGSRSIAVRDMMSGVYSNQVTFKALPSIQAPLSMTAQIGTDNMMGGTNLKYIGVTASFPTDSYGRLESWQSPSIQFQVASDAAFSNILASQRGYSMMGTSYPVSTTFRGQMDQWNMSVISEFVTGQTYYVRARVTNMSNDSGNWTAPIAYRIPNTPPTSPTGVSATVDENTTVTLSWNPSSQQEGGDPVEYYEVVVTAYDSMCSMMGSCSNTPVGTVVYPTDRLQTGATVTGLTSGSQYKATIYAVSTSGSKSIPGFNNMTMQSTGTVTFTAIPSVAAPLSLSTQVGYDSMTGGTNLKYIGVTSYLPTDSYGRLDGSPSIQFQVATDAAFTNVLATQSQSSMAGSAPVTLTFRGQMDQWNMSVISEFVTGQTYYVRARVSYYSMSSGSGYGLWTSPVAYKIPNTPPTSPAVVNATVAEDTTVTLSWTPSSQQEGGDPVDHYEVVVTAYDSMCSMMGSCSNVPQGTVTYSSDPLATTATISGLTAGSRYKATVYAVSTSGSKSIPVFNNATMQWTGYTTFAAVPSMAAPSVSATVGYDSNSGTMNPKFIEVTAVRSDDSYGRLDSGSNYFYYEVATDSAFTNVVARSVMNMMGSTPVSATFRGVQERDYIASEFVAGQTYYVRVRVSFESMQYGSGYSLWSAPLAYTLPTTPPTSPTGVTATVSVDGSVAVAWNASSQQDGGDPVDHYEVVVVDYNSGMCNPGVICGRTPRGTVVYPTDRLQTSATVTGLTPNATYEVIVYAVSTSGSKSYSVYDYTTGWSGRTAVDVVVPAPAPTVVVTAGSESSILNVTVTRTADLLGRDTNSAQDPEWYYEIATDEAFNYPVASYTGTSSEGSLSRVFYTDNNGNAFTPGTYYVRARLYYRVADGSTAWTLYSTPVAYTVSAPVAPPAVSLSGYSFDATAWSTFYNAAGGDATVSSTWSSETSVLVMNANNTYAFIDLGSVQATLLSLPTGTYGPATQYAVNGDFSVTTADFSGSALAIRYFTTDPTVGPATLTQIPNI